MTLRFCPREEEAAASVRAGNWPNACEAEIRAHVEGCRRCAEVVAVTEALRQQRIAAMKEARLPSASAIWWRARLAQQQQAANAVIRPIAWAERIGVFAAVLSMVGMVAWQRNWVDAWLTWFANTTQIASFWLDFTHWVPLLAIAGGAGLFLTALAFYFWAEDH